jgi:hypothetical protein
MTHNVEFSIPKWSLGSSDDELNDNKDSEKLGTVQVSNGSVVWFPHGTSYGY